MPKRNVYTPTRAQRLRGESQVNDCTLWELLDEVSDRIKLTNGADFCPVSQLIHVVAELNGVLYQRYLFPNPEGHPGNEI